MSVFLFYYAASILIILVRTDWLDFLEWEAWYNVVLIAVLLSTIAPVLLPHSIYKELTD